MLYYDGYKVASLLAPRSMMFPNELHPGETLGGTLDAMIAELLEEYRIRKEQEEADYTAALAAAKPLLDVLAVLGPWLSVGRSYRLVEVSIRTLTDGVYTRVVLEWNQAAGQWTFQFPDTDHISIEALGKGHLRLLANVDYPQLAATIATMAIELGVAPPRFSPQDSACQDAPRGK